MKKRKLMALNPYVLIFCVIVVCGLLTFIITPGTLKSGVYTSLPRNVVNFNNIFNIFRAIPYGIKDSANIVVLILVVGGALEVYKQTGAIDAGISNLVNRFGAGSKTALLVTLIVVFSAIGGFLGWIEVLIPFVPLVVAVVLALGYDSMTAVAVCTVGTMGGFMAGPTNLYTVGICNSTLQKLGLISQSGDLFPGLGLRIAVWGIITLTSVIYIAIYAQKTYKNPEKSLVAGIDTSDIKADTSDSTVHQLTPRHSLVLLSILGAMILTIIGMKIGFNGVTWGIDDVSAIFFLSGIFSAIVGRMKAGETANAFLTGAKASIGGAMIVGVARGVYWVLDAGQVNATIIFKTTELLRGTSPFLAAAGIVLIVSLINGLIPSGSGKAALLSPILVPIGVNLGLSTQTSVLAYQFGDGITNMAWFTYGTLLIFLNYGKVPLNKWYQFIMPLIGIFFLIAFLVLAVALKIHY